MKISIIMPVYNSAKYLEESVGDILRQTFDDFELICVYDEGTTDGSDELLYRIAEDDERIRVIYHEIRGSNACRNRGLDEAAGKYVLFLDADDRFEPDMLEMAVKEAENEGFNVVVFGGDTFDDESGLQKKAPWLIKSNDRVIEEDPFRVINTTAWNKLFLRDYIVRHGIRFLGERNAYTVYFVFMAVIWAGKIGVLHKELIHYRVNNRNSTTAGIDEKPMGACAEFTAIKKSLEIAGIYEENRIIFEDYVREYLSDRFRLFKTYEGFSKMYKGLQDEVIDLLDLGCYKYFEIIKNKDIGEYLFEEHKRLIDDGFIEKNCWLLSVKPNGMEARFAIYGGGNVGRDYFIQAMRRNDISIACWVDRDYEKIGFPLQSPDVLKETEYDLVLIAVMDEKTAGSIRKDLLGMGIPENKVIWKAPERI